MAEILDRRRRVRLGEILRDAGLITPDQLNRALEICQATGNRLGQVLMDMGLVDQDHVAEVLSKQIGTEFVRLTGLHLPEEILTLIPPTVASELQAIPIGQENGRLTVAMVDPLDVLAQDDIRRLTGMDLRVVVTTVRDFQYALNQYRSKVGDPMAEMLRRLPPKVIVDEQVSLEQQIRQAQEQPIVRLVNQMIEEAVRRRATDIHIEPQGRHIRIRYRIDGVLLARVPLPEHILPQVVSRIKIMANLDIAERRVPQDGSFQTAVDGRPIDVRVSTVPSFFGEKVVLRLLDKAAPIYDLNKLGLSTRNLERLHRIISRPQGIFLLTGPTGSGKTTTLYAILNKLNNEQVNILTIEDPVEYQISGVTQVQVNRRAGVDFDSALQHFLRQDPDIMMVGEVRNEATARIAIQAALTGHLVLSTLHTNDALGAVTRLVEMGIEPYLVASALAGVAAQRLVRTLCPKCKQPDALGWDEIKVRFGAETPAGDHLRAVGCDFCDYTGYRGRVAIFEIAEVSEMLRHQIVTNEPHHLLKERAKAEGMATLLQDGLEKAAQGVTSLTEVERVVYVEPANGDATPS